MTREELNKLLASDSETEHLEFKEASTQISILGKDDTRGGKENKKSVYGYCVAIGNEGGGKLILGVKNDINPQTGMRDITGTNAIPNINITREQIYKVIGRRIEVEEIETENGKVQIVDIPPHPVGEPFKFYGAYLMRNGENLENMDTGTLSKIINETRDDFSALCLKGLTISDLDDAAIDSLRGILIKNNKKVLSDLDNQKLLSALELITDKGVTFTGLILLGKKEKIDEILPCAEIIYEWRQEEKINHDYRKEWREPFLKVYDEIWETINNRNTRIPIQEGLIQNEVLAFNEKAIREALLNAITHRDYSIQSQSIFIKADNKKMVVISPGGFLPGITPENVIEKQASRNRRLADVFQKLGLVERSGQGMDQIFETTIREGKGLPDLSKTDNFQVVLNIPAQIKDKNFILFLQKVSQERQIIFSFEEIYELELLRENSVVDSLRNKNKFLELGIIEKVGKTSGTKYILSHRYYKYEDKPGIYTRIRGLSRDHKKELILEHIKRERSGKKKDFIDAFPDLKVSDISNFLQELKSEGKIERVGSDIAGYWRLVDGSN